MHDVPLFELPDPPPTKRAKTLRELEAEARLKWSRLHLKNRVPCDECILLLHEAGGVGSYANSARWRLTRGAKVLYLCNKHTQAWRKDEDLE